MLCQSRCNAVISLPVCSCLQIANGASELGWSKMTLSDSNLTLSGLGLVGPLWNPVWVHGGAGSCSLPYRYSQGLLQSSARSWCSVDYYGTNESVPLRLKLLGSEPALAGISTEEGCSVGGRRPYRFCDVYRRHPRSLTLPGCHTTYLGLQGLSHSLFVPPKILP